MRCSLSISMGTWHQSIFREAFFHVIEFFSTYSMKKEESGSTNFYAIVVKCGLVILISTRLKLCHDQYVKFIITNFCTLH